MITSSPEELIANVNALRKREGKRVLNKRQVAMIHEQVIMRARLGRFTLFPEVLEERIARRTKEMMLRGSS